MRAWCTTAEVQQRLAATATNEMLVEHANAATSLLHDMTGRKFSGVNTVTATHEIDRRGYVRLTAWAPVRAVSAVSVNGVAVPPGSFALSPAGTYLMLSSGYARGIAAITMRVGQAPPVSGIVAAAALAAETLKSDRRYSQIAGATDTIALPRPTSVTRQGVTYTYTDVADLNTQGFTGITEVDLFIKAANPSGGRNQPKVVVP